LPGVVGGLGGRGDEAADLAGRAAGVGRLAVAEVLSDGARRGRLDAVVVAVPAGVAVEALGPLGGRQGAGQPVAEGAGPQPQPPARLAPPPPPPRPELVRAARPPPF